MEALLRRGQSRNVRGQEATPNDIPLDDVTIDPSQEIGKRLKYIRAIFSHSFSLPSRVESNHHLPFCLLEIITLKKNLLL